jgi:hypothetical protein
VPDLSGGPLGPDQEDSSLLQSSALTGAPTWQPFNLSPFCFCVLGIDSGAPSQNGSPDHRTSPSHPSFLSRDRPEQNGRCISTATFRIPGQKGAFSPRSRWTAKVIHSSLTCLTEIRKNLHREGVPEVISHAAPRKSHLTLVLLSVEGVPHKVSLPCGAK